MRVSTYKRYVQCMKDAHSKGLTLSESGQTRGERRYFHLVKGKELLIETTDLRRIEKFVQKSLDE